MSVRCLGRGGIAFNKQTNPLLNLFLGTDGGPNPRQRGPNLPLHSGWQPLPGRPVPWTAVALLHAVTSVDSNDGTQITAGVKELVVSTEAHAPQLTTQSSSTSPCPDFDDTSSQRQRLQALLSRHGSQGPFNSLEIDCSIKDF